MDANSCIYCTDVLLLHGREEENDPPSINTSPGLDFP